MQPGSFEKLKAISISHPGSLRRGACTKRKPIRANLRNRRDFIARGQEATWSQARLKPRVRKASGFAAALCCPLGPHHVIPCPLSLPLQLPSLHPDWTLEHGRPFIRFPCCLSRHLTSLHVSVPVSDNCTGSVGPHWLQGEWKGRRGGPGQRSAVKGAGADFQ